MKKMVHPWSDLTFPEFDELGIDRKPLFFPNWVQFKPRNKDHQRSRLFPIQHASVVFRGIPWFQPVQVCMVFNHVLRQHRHGDEALHVLELVGKAQNFRMVNITGPVFDFGPFEKGQNHLGKTHL